MIRFRILVMRPSCSAFNAGLGSTPGWVHKPAMHVYPLGHTQSEEQDEHVSGDSHSLFPQTVPVWQVPQSVGHVEHVSLTSHLPFPHTIPVGHAPQSDGQFTQASPASHAPLPHWETTVLVMHTEL